MRACMHLVWLFVFVDVHAWTCLNTNMGGAEDNLYELILSLHYVGSED